MQSDDPGAAAAPFNAAFTDSQIRRRQRIAEAAVAEASAAFPPDAMRKYFFKKVAVEQLIQRQDPALIAAALADALGAQIGQLATCFKQDPDRTALNFLQLVAQAARSSLEAQKRAIAELAAQAPAGEPS
ncbi:MAG TPA: hypothetical protein VKU03_12435 [Roseiarcus sp.]|nr:hypothetical protein [Roseiarcus sp.]